MTQQWCSPELINKRLLAYMVKKTKSSRSIATAVNIIKKEKATPNERVSQVAP
jgi:hypothetical protein